MIFMYLVLIGGNGMDHHGQGLLDVTNQVGFPTSFTWPTKFVL